MKVQDSRGNIFYYKDDGVTCHREDGPAWELSSGDKYYFWNGERLNYLDWLRKTDELNNTIIEIDNKQYKLQRIL